MALPSVERLREFSLDKEDAVEIEEIEPALEKELEQALQSLGFNAEELAEAFAKFKKDNYLEHPNLLGASTAKTIVQKVDDLAEEEDKTATTATTATEVKDMRTSDKGISLIKEFEGFRSNCYKCSAGVPTIGYGSTRHPDGRKIAPGDCITEEKAIEYLRHDVKKFEDSVKKYVDVPLTQAQFDALVCFVYNIGSGALQNSTLRKKLNKKDYSGAAKEFLRWCKAGGRTLPGLKRRRVAEKQLFESA